MTVLLQQFIKIFNTLATISTKGEDTLVMAECLKALRNGINDFQTLIEQNESEE